MFRSRLTAPGYSIQATTKPQGRRTVGKVEGIAGRRSDESCCTRTTQKAWSFWKIKCGAFGWKTGVFAYNARSALVGSLELLNGIVFRSLRSFLPSVLIRRSGRLDAILNRTVSQAMTSSFHHPHRCPRIKCPFPGIGLWTGSSQLTRKCQQVHNIPFTIKPHIS